MAFGHAVAVDEDAVWKCSFVRFLPTLQALRRHFFEVERDLFGVLLSADTCGILGVVGILASDNSDNASCGIGLAFGERFRHINPDNHGRCW